MRLSATLFAVVALLAAPMARAEPLTDGQVRAFSATLPEIEQLVNAHKADGGPAWNDDVMDPKPGEDWKPMSGVVGGMRGSPMYDDFVELVGRHGFASAEAWGTVGDRVTRAMVVLQLEQQDPNYRENMEAAIAQIDANEGLTEERRQAMRGALKETLAMLEMIANAPAEDVEVVRPNLDRLINAMESGE